MTSSISSRCWTWLLGAALLACSPPQRPITLLDAGRLPPPECAPFAPLANRGSLEDAQQAHRWAELKRHLRFMEVLEPGYLLRHVATTLPQPRLDQGQFCPQDIYELGRLIFEHEFTRAEGLGNGLGDGSRASPFRRVQDGRFGGPETTGCTSCHWRGGPAGAGSMQDNSFILGRGDRIEDADARNPPALSGVGVAQLVAGEMTAQLQTVRRDLIAQARSVNHEVEAPLVANKVSFGTIKATPDGSVDYSRVKGVDGDLVVKALGWKGNVEAIRDFVAESLQLHVGIQSEHLLRMHQEPDVVGTGSNRDDPDGDGVTHELDEGQLTALVGYLAMLEMPVVRPHQTVELPPAAPGLFPPPAFEYTENWVRGRRLFETTGCAACHVPMMVLHDPVYRTTSVVTGGTVELDLSESAESPHLQFDETLNGYPVMVFSDFKRHDMGRENASLHEDRGVAEQEFMTRRLWGLANSGPYFYDGHAPWFDHAIMAHGGEAAPSRDNFAALDVHAQGDLKVYLLSLRRERRAFVP